MGEIPILVRNHFSATAVTGGAGKKETPQNKNLSEKGKMKRSVAFLVPNSILSLVGVTLEPPEDSLLAADAALEESTVEP